MVLLADMGNTNVTVAGWGDGGRVFELRLPTDHSWDGAAYTMALREGLAGAGQADALFEGAALCGVVLTGTVMAVNRHLEKADAAPTAAESAGERIATTQDIGAYFSARGLEVDLSTAAVDEVKVPRKWDEDFKAFDEVVKQSGQGLKKYRGKAVEKWTAACPARSTGESTCQAVLLVYKKKPVGAYLRTEPGGEVLGLNDAAATPAPLNREEAAAAELFGEEALETALDGEAAEAETELAQAGAEPVE